MRGTEHHVAETERRNETAVPKQRDDQHYRLTSSRVRHENAAIPGGAPPDARSRGVSVRLFLRTDRREPVVRRGGSMRAVRTRRASSMLSAIRCARSMKPISRLGVDTRSPCRLLEQGQPAIEVPSVDRQPQMFPHRLAMISAGHERDRRPERKHLLQKMRLPI